MSAVVCRKYANYHQVRIQQAFELRVQVPAAGCFLCYHADVLGECMCHSVHAIPDRRSVPCSCVHACIQARPLLPAPGGTGWLGWECCNRCVWRTKCLMQIARDLCLYLYWAATAGPVKHIQQAPPWCLLIVASLLFIYTCCPFVCACGVVPQAAKLGHSKVSCLHKGCLALY